MNRKLNLMIAVAVAAMLPMSVHAGRKVTDDKAGIELEVPDAWKESRDENSLTIEPKDEAVALVFQTLEAENADAVIKAIDAELVKSLGPIVWENEGKGKDIDINGMKGKEWDGTAKEGAMIISCLALDTPAANILSIYYFATPESEKTYNDDLTAIIQSLKPQEGAGEGEGEEEGEEEGGEEGKEE